MRYVVSCDALADSSISKLGLTVAKYYEVDFDTEALTQFCTDLKAFGYEISARAIRNAKEIKEDHVDDDGEVLWQDEVGFEVQTLFKGASKTLTINVYCLDI